MSDWPGSSVWRSPIVIGAVLAMLASGAEASLFGGARRPVQTVSPYPAAPHPAVCRIAVEERDGMAYGSGTLIDCRETYGLVVTNWHVVHEARGKIEVRFPDGFTSEARQLKLDETWDLAALVVWRPPTQPARLATAPPRPGDRLTICGYGQGEYLQQTGRCTDYYSPEVGEPQEIVELNVQARQGDSGGPIFNDRGELAGVLFGAARGTTLGSFGGRVQSFLATLAPDIGVAKQPPTMLTQASASPPAPVVLPSTPPSASTTPSASLTGDPFLAAERSSPGPTAPLDRPPPALSDRNSAPQLASTHHTSEAWKPVTLAASIPPAPAPPAGFARQFSEVSAAPDGTGLDWYEEGRTFLALVGVAALVLSGLRVLS